MKAYIDNIYSTIIESIFNNNFMNRYNNFEKENSPQRSQTENHNSSAYDFQDISEKYTLGNSKIKPKFQHNLLLPTRNAREFKKLLTGSKQKFIEMIK